jgi:hypothetical protein
MQEVKRLQALLQQQAADLQAFADSDPEVRAGRRNYMHWTCCGSCRCAS